MPPRRAISPGSNALVSVTSAVMLVSIIVRQSSRLASCAGLVPCARPALLTSRSMLRKPSGSASSAACIASASRMSKAATWMVLRPICSASASSRSARRPVATMRQPASAKRRAVARPKPEVAPVTKTVLIIGLSGFEGDHDHAQADQRHADPFAQAQALAEEYEREHRDQQHAELVDRGDVGGGAGLERAEITDPRGTGRERRRAQEAKGGPRQRRRV